ncbi:ABC transporter [Microbacterium sp. NPDC058345]|uniref:ABC transporter n=1 Tax=Microbacterium sp. NPDC058345 TaxID=3346455 RepID=UPI0036693FEF
MSDPEVPKNEQPHDVDHVVGSANEGLDAAAAARADVPGTDEPAVDAPATEESPAASNPVDDRAAADHDADLAAFEAAEREHPGTFGGSDAADDTATRQAPAADDAPVTTAAAATRAASVADEDRFAQYERSAEYDRPAEHEPNVADTAYGAPDAAAETRVVPAEPTVVAAPQPIFVQAPEPPRELGNRGAAGAIGLVAAVAFGILYLGAILGFGALAGDVTGENIGDAALAPLTTWSFWVPVVVFFLAFWLLGAFINRGRWGKWVIFGLLVGAAAYGGHILGQLFQEPFWRVTASESAELVNEQLLAPLAIAAFIFGRELTIWFGAWVARSGARKKVLNAEAQAEYERTLEAGPAALR